eukprot:TRINITY_DN20021_c0_g1_i1.p1 TRINITY_DN20021_c0_g1~~TRINITY_DN20021_c0_g1_i1.p1  ORF type:complete len:634 (+),score=127.66 TRINITY_DN20021_c0_g1_i1:50-1951(+)
MGNSVVSKLGCHACKSSPIDEEVQSTDDTQRVVDEDDNRRSGGAEKGAFNLRRRSRTKSLESKDAPVILEREDTSEVEVYSAAEDEADEPERHPRSQPDDAAAGWSVKVERSYDLFDALTKRKSALPMPSSALHKRFVATIRQRNKPLGIDDMSTPSICSQYGSESDSSVSLPPSGEYEAVVYDSPAPMDKAQSAVEVTSKWGVLLGKVLYSRVLAMHTASSTYMGRSREAKPQKSTVASSVKKRAQDTVKQARKLAKLISQETEDCFDCDWTSGVGKNLLSWMFTSEYFDSLMILAKAGKKLLASQPVLATAKCPARVFGDIHGQFRDMLILFSAYGWPGVKPTNGEPATTFIFNGDFVDRGAHQIETIGLLLALKVAFPTKVWLVRGNHEDRSMNEKYGFKDTCIQTMGQALGLKIYDLLEAAFDQLPIACLVEGRILCVHGGIGKGDWDLINLRSLHRPITSQVLSQPDKKWLLNILWSDPIEDDDDMVSDEEREGVKVFRRTSGVHDSPRKQEAVQFGWDVTKTFCARNGLGLVIRSHQCKQDGHGFDIMHDDHLVRVFSARDYEGCDNDSATVIIRNVAEDSESSHPLEAAPPKLEVRFQGLSSHAKAVQVQSEKELKKLGKDKKAGA